MILSSLKSSLSPQCCFLIFIYVGIRKFLETQPERRGADNGSSALEAVPASEVTEKTQINLGKTGVEFQAIYPNTVARAE